VRVVAADANDTSVRSGPADVLVLDPPRAGAKALPQIVAQKKPERVVYVSCHMTTLGRDLAALGELGYRADAVHVFDMFPHTAHVEAVVRMRKTSV
jgi:23S rRNA (uracil1939-C5)-methyltransferase